MIDLLVVLGLATATVQWACRSFSFRRSMLLLVSGALVAHAVCIAQLYAFSWHPIYRAFPATSPQRGFGPVSFWTPMDSYELEYTTGGQVFFPRKPIYRAFLIPISQQISDTIANPMRILSADGVEAPTIPALLEALKALPPKGISTLRVMHSTPDIGVRIVFYAPSAFAADPLNPTERPEELAQVQLGFSGVPLLSATGEATSLVSNFAAAGAGTYALPRLALLPRLYEGPVSSFLAGVPALFLRPLLSLSNLLSLAKLHNALPKQLYLLDDPITAPTFFFLVSSLLACCALAQAFRKRSWLVFAAAMALQTAELMVIHAF